jgi:GNAT superfamily N-acetyltransferase
MSSYRFCRTDDVQLLVDAYNRCCPALDGNDRLTVESFRRAMHELDLWCSSCMVAHEGAEPIAVLLAGKRDSGNLIHAIGVHPDHRRRGHGKHLLTSLSAKLAILGPPRLLAELPAEWSEARTFFEACGYRPERDYVDWERSAAGLEPSPPAASAAQLMIPVGVDELLDAGELGRDDASRSWWRAARTLARQKDRVAGWAIATDRIEACLLYRDTPSGNVREILSLRCAAPERREAFCGLLLRRCTGERVAVLRIPRIADAEIPGAELRSWGFRPTRRYVGFAARAVPA